MLYHKYRILAVITEKEVNAMTPKPFYENRDKHYSCHIWLHPNYPKHLHKHVEFAYVQDGSMNMSVNGISQVMTAGCCALVFPNQIHSYSSVGDVQLMLIIMDMEYVDDFFDELNFYEMQNPFFHKSMLTHYGQRTLDLLFYSAHEKNVPYSISKGLTTALLGDIFTTLPFVRKKQHTEQSTTERILLYINENIRFDLSAKTMAKELGISPYHLSRIFSKELKMSFPSYVTHHRLNLACDLLRDTQRNITDIAYDVGFSSSRNFLRCFKDKYGCTPTEWRNINSEKASIQPLSPKL